VINFAVHPALHYFCRVDKLSDRFGFALRAGHFFPIGQQHVDKLNDRIISISRLVDSPIRRERSEHINASPNHRITNIKWTLHLKYTANC
jgi:hypothetical protein